MEIIKNFIRDLKSTNLQSGIMWFIAIGFVILVFGFGNSYPMNFGITTTIFFLFIMIHGYQSEIKRLEDELERRDDTIKALIEEDIKRYRPEEYIVGTERKRTELDGYLDEYILNNYYSKHKEKRTLENDKEILKETYLKKKQ